jgi:hypothetical protein
MTPSYNANIPTSDDNDVNTQPPQMRLAPGMPGWHPQSFQSEGGITAVLERRRREVEDRLHGGGGPVPPAVPVSGARPGGPEAMSAGGVLLGRGRYEPAMRIGGDGGMI